MHNPTLAQLRVRRATLMQTLRENEAAFLKSQLELTTELDRIISLIDRKTDEALAGKGQVTEERLTLNALHAFAKEHGFTENAATAAWNVLVGPDLQLFMAQHSPETVPPTSVMYIPVNYLLAVARVVEPRNGVKGYGSYSFNLVQTYATSYTKTV